MEDLEPFHFVLIPYRLPMHQKLCLNKKVVHIRRSKSQYFPTNFSKYLTVLDLLLPATTASERVLHIHPCKQLDVFTFRIFRQAVHKKVSCTEYTLSYVTLPLTSVSNNLPRR